MSKTFPVQTNKAYLIESDQDATVTSVDGVSIANVEEDRGQVTIVAPVNELVVSNDDAKVQTLIKKVQVLVNGQIRYAEIDGDNTFTGDNTFLGDVTFSGNVEGLPEGPAGPQGDPGPEGKSAYQIWLDEGNQGTEEEFLNSLKGPKGDTGATGADGATGPQGAPGPQGDPGESAYQIWLNEGNSGTEADFLASLKGAKGDTGPQGAPGTDGATGPQGEPGKSAYEIAVEKGYTGTEDEWATVQINAAQNAADAANSATVAESYAKEAANSALSATGLPLSYHLSRLAKTSAEWEAIATRMAGCVSNDGTVEARQDRLLKIRQGSLCYPQYTTTGNWVFGQSWYGDSNSNFDTTTWEIVIDASSITSASVFLFSCLNSSWRRIFIFAPNMTKNDGASFDSPWTHEIDGVFTVLNTTETLFANKTRTHSMPWCAGQTIGSLVNINKFMQNNVALPADQFPIGLPNVTNAQDAFLNCTLLTQEVADAILNSLPAVEAGANGKGTITFTGTAASTSWRAEGADLTAVNAATEKGWTVEY